MTWPLEIFPHMLTVDYIYYNRSLAAHHFAESGRVLERVPDVDERPPLVVQVLLQPPQLRAQVIYEVAKVLDSLEALAEVSGMKKEDNPK